MMGAITGAVVGLAAITPSAGYVSVISALIIGLVVSPLCYFFITYVKFKLGYDDALDAFGCHGIGCIWGVLATGLFASKAVNPAGANGLFFGNPAQLGIQAIAVVVTIAFSGTMSFIIIKAISIFIRLRENETVEEDGMDFSQHGESAYPDMSNE